MGRQRRVLTPDRSAVHRWGAQLRALRDERGLSLAGLSRQAQYDAGYLGRVERGDQFATLPVAQACDRVLDAGGELVRAWRDADRERRQAQGPGAAGEAAGGTLPDGDAAGQLVTVMPLHVVTAMYGEAGLRARFAAEIVRLPDPAGRERAERALELAGRLHAARPAPARAVRQPPAAGRVADHPPLRHRRPRRHLRRPAARRGRGPPRRPGPGRQGRGRRRAGRAVRPAGRRAGRRGYQPPGGNLAVTGTTSTGPMSRRAWRRTRGRG